MRKTLDRIGGCAALIVVVWPVMHWLIWFYVHAPQGFRGFGPDPNALRYLIDHPILWRLTVFPEFIASVAIALVIFTGNEYIRQVEPVWSRFITWLGVMVLVTSLFEATLSNGILPWFAKNSPPEDPRTASAYLAMRALLWVGIWLSVIATSSVTVLMCGILLVRKGAPKLFCYIGFLDAAVGFMALEGAKIFRIANSLLAAAWAIWLAVLFFRGTLVPQARFDDAAQTGGAP